MANVLISLGGNLGDPADAISHALRKLTENDHIEVTRSSTLYRTKAVGGSGPQSDFQNAAATLRTSLSPRQLLQTMNEIETQLGRVREQKWDARTIDLDILLFHDVFMAESDLVIPHPRMIVRQFVLQPAADIAPDMVHSGNGWSIKRLFQHARNAYPWFAISNSDYALCKRVFEATLNADSACKASYALEHTLDYADRMMQSGNLDHVADLFKHALNLLAWWFENGEIKNPYAALLVSRSIRDYAQRLGLENTFAQRLNEMIRPKLLIKFGEPKKTPRSYQPILYIDPTDLQWAAREINAAAAAMR